MHCRPTRFPTAKTILFAQFILILRLFHWKRTRTQIKNGLMIQFLFALIDIRLLCMTDGCPVPPYIFSGRLHRFLLHHGGGGSERSTGFGTIAGILTQIRKKLFLQVIEILIYCNRNTCPGRSRRRESVGRGGNRSIKHPETRINSLA